MHKQAVMDLSPWSLSKAQTALNCPFKFQKTYLEKRAGIPPKRRGGELGSIIHRVLEMTLKGESIRDAFQKALTATPLTTEEREEVMSYAHNIQSFLDRIKRFCEKQRVTQTYIEHGFGLTVDNRPTGFYGQDVFFRGRWDVGLLTASKHLILIDHKTGEPKPVHFYKDQLHFYAISALSTIPDLQGVQSAIHNVGIEEIAWGDMISRGDIESRLVPWFGEFLEKATVSGASGKPTKSWLCNYCEHTDICPLQIKQE